MATSSTGVDFVTDPVLRLGDRTVHEAAGGLRLVDRRARVLDIEKTPTSIELDPYIFIPDAHLARRRNAVNHGDSTDRKGKDGQDRTVEAGDEGGRSLLRRPHRPRVNEGLRFEVAAAALPVPGDRGLFFLPAARERGRLTA